MCHTREACPETRRLMCDGAFLAGVAPGEIFWKQDGSNVFDFVTDHETLQAGTHVEAEALVTAHSLARLFEDLRSSRKLDHALIRKIVLTIQDIVAEHGVLSWVEAMSAIEDQTDRHCLLMAGVAAGFTNYLSCDQGYCQRMIQACLLHDVGKVLVPRAVLDKCAPLMPDERMIMRGHPELGYRLLEQQGGFDPMTLDIVLHHHEQIDGKGYPKGLSGAQVSREVRIAAVCDIFAALIEKRSYKQALSPPCALATMRRMPID